MSEIVSQIIIKVYLVSGKEKTHIYKIPTSDKELTEFLKDMFNKTMILTRDSKGYLFFENPSITYNANNVEGIEISSIGVKELETLLRKAQSGIGFSKQ